MLIDATVSVTSRSVADVEQPHVVTDTGAIDLSGSDNWVLHADNADVLPQLPDSTFRLIYIDPPFNSGKVQRRQELSTIRSEDGDRVGFGGQAIPNRLSRAPRPTPTSSMTTSPTSGLDSSTPTAS